MTPELNSIFRRPFFLNCLLYFIVQAHRKKDWWRLLFSFKANSFEDVGRSASSQTRGDIRVPKNLDKNRLDLAIQI